MYGLNLPNNFYVYFIQGEIDAAVKELLSLKASFKSSFGVEWGPNVASSLAPANAAISTPTSTNKDSLSIQIKECGDKVRDLKAKKAEKVCTLNKLKQKFSPNNNFLVLFLRLKLTSQ